MQAISWTISRLGSRFCLHFEPYRRRVLHSALGRFLDQPLDLMVGLVEPDGTERALPFTTRGESFYLTEQFERPNSVTFRAYSRDYGLRFEFNVHSVFYPQDERLCLMPAFYLEMRVNPAERVRWSSRKGPQPEHVKVFLRLNRPHTRIQASRDESARIDLTYVNTLTPRLDDPVMGQPLEDDGRTAKVTERLVSLNPDAVPDGDGQGMSLDLPVTQIGSGVKWRLVWGAYCPDPVLQVYPDDQAAAGPDQRTSGNGPSPGGTPARFRYRHYWDSLDAVMEEAIGHRDDYLARSRLFEKLLEQAPLGPAKSHLLNQSLQAFLANTFWCELDEPEGPRPWFSVWEGSALYHSTIDVEYNTSLFYLMLWPSLLALQFDQWARHETPHRPSGGSFLDHDMGRGTRITRQAYQYAMPVEENADYLLMMQAYIHWTGDKRPAQRHADLIQRLAAYLLWTDRDGSGFPSEGTANTIADGSPAAHYARKQTYLAVKRLAALSAATDLLTHAGRGPAGEPYDNAATRDAPRIAQAAWLSDHFAICLDRSAAGLADVWTGESLPLVEVPGWDGYSIYTSNGLLLPLLCGQPLLFDREQLTQDLMSAIRETLSPYGCGHTTNEPDNVWVSQNLWRDHIARYLGLAGSSKTHRYWDLQVMSNAGDQSLGFTDTYIGNYLCFYPRGVCSLGFLLAFPRLVIDRLAPGGPRITVEPDRESPQRWPLLPLADWKAGKVPVCVTDTEGRVFIENDLESVIIRGETVEDVESGMIG